jgi:mutator protein MutT
MNNARTKNIACCILINDKNELLLQKKTTDYKPYPGCWALFGGAIEEGEDPEEAIIREIKEETGLLVEPTFYLKRQYKAPYGHSSGTEYIFTATINGTSNICLSEGAGFAFFSLEETGKLDKLCPDYEMLKGVFT